MSAYWTGYVTGAGGFAAGQLLHVIVGIARDHFRIRQIMRMANDRMVQDAERFANQGDV